MENQWLAYVKRLQAIASTGLHFAEGVFDRERFEEIAAISNAMLADLGSVPIERIPELMPPMGTAYATPMVEVRGVVIVDGKILLVREKFDGLWTLPGGYADVGLSGAENTAKEVWEEAGLRVEVKSLISVRHKAKGGYRADPRDFYKLYFLCESAPGAVPKIGVETTDVGFFAPDALPPLSEGRTIASDITDAFRFVRGEITTTIFD
ncbi:NUDIX hydrolase [Robbsia sp. KACC 23696]|uniref:NUDIX hydrolase n=1 Tax=Robbsia sp. KACC 23696 TaxID=3149231 RepID=UPI00325AC380